VNLGYLLLSVSTTVGFALFANKVAYLGQIFILISMYLTIARLSGFKFNKKLAVALILIGVLVFAMICTTGYLPWYYKSVSLEYVDGAAKLVKEYGPLHVVYLIYVLAYFALMVGTIAISIHSKIVSSSKHAGLLTAVVLCNIAMWIVEKFVVWNFEFLSISYILSEGMLFFLYWMMQDYVHKDDIPASVIVEEKQPIFIVETEDKAKRIQCVLEILPEGKRLSVRQLDVLDGIICGKSRKEIAADLHLSENTVKMHTTSLFKALGVKSREEIYLLLKE
jgi:DNA-binding CsgD family transcriptional regulator